MPARVEVNPRLLAWARERSGLAVDELTHRFPMLAEWEDGDRSPTFKQLENFARATHTPVGFLFLSEPPDEAVPIPDYRTMENLGVTRPSPNLLDTIYLCEQRQQWYREFAQVAREDRVELVGALTLATPVLEAAITVRATLAFEVDQRGFSRADALRTLIERVEDLGVLVMVSGVVGSNTHRKLDANEFRGFALVDDLAPVIFLNGSDTKAAQIFTLVHELMHLWLGGAALDDADLASDSTAGVERWCNQVAAEVLLPAESLRREVRDDEGLTEGLERVANRFKVSTLVVLRRLYDIGHLSWDIYRAAYAEELQRILEILDERSGSGGNFFNTQPARVSKRFARAVIASTLEGQTLHRDAFSMLGFKKLSTFNELAGRLGFGG